MILIGERCNFCSKPRPEFRFHRLTTGQIICDYCLEWHMHALEFLGGAPPRGCQECGVTFEALRAASPDVEIAIRMFVIPKDGIYQLLCQACAAPYVQKRNDLYRGTRFGKEVLKIA